MDKKFEEFEKEIDKMSEEEMLYVRLTPHEYLIKKFGTQINHSKELIQDIDNNIGNIKANEEEANKQNTNLLNECNKLKLEIEQTKQRINKLLLEKQGYNKRPNKKEFITDLDLEIKSKFKTPDNCFKDFLSNKMTIDQFGEKMKEMGQWKNYYYYKVLSDKLKEMP